jgi:hypothetical protein
MSPDQDSEYSDQRPADSSGIDQLKPKRAFGAMRGQIHIGPEFFEPLPEEELERWGV